MSGPQWTPGPWRFSPYYDVRRKAYSKTRWQGIFEPVPGQDVGHISRVLTVGIQGQVDDYWISTSEANARLIEAAPGLYTALDELIGAWTWWNEDTFDRCGSVVWEAVSDARDVLAKARGETETAATANSETAPVSDIGEPHS